MRSRVDNKEDFDNIPTEADVRAEFGARTTYGSKARVVEDSMEIDSAVFGRRDIPFR